MNAYAIVSDIHLHPWSAFASATPEGLNSRLKGLLDELWRAALEVKKAGGAYMMFAGDLFHVRGQLAPSVLNPMLDLAERIHNELGIRMVMIPGNHDLEGKDSVRLGNGIVALERYAQIIDTPTLVGQVALIPWFDSVEKLKEEIEALKARFIAESRDLKQIDLIIHAPVNGVIMGIPDNGVDAAWLAEQGFKRVFAGHYHNHKDFPGRVYSIGALAHHTWGDVGTQAGFLIVHKEQVDFHPSELPEFVDITPQMAAGDIAKLVKGNYARVRTSSNKPSDIEKLRDWLTKAGALGVVIVSIKAPVEERTGAVAASVRSGASIEQSVTEFIKGKNYAPEIAPAIQTESLRCLAEAEVV